VRLSDPDGRASWDGLLTRGAGVLRVIGGISEARNGISFGVATSWTGIGAVAGGVVTAHGIDTAIAGARQVWTGEWTQTGTSQALQTYVGLSTSDAEYYDSMASVVFSLGANAAATSKLGSLAAAERSVPSTLSTSAAATAGAIGAEVGGPVVNAKGVAYPRVLDPRTGEPIPAPPAGLSKVPKADRTPRGDARDRGAYIKEYYDRGYSTPEGGWKPYDIHHIIPLEYGGTNDFDNRVPVDRTVHQQQFNPWWANYGN
jgi:hypothetical protein